MPATPPARRNERSLTCSPPESSAAACGGLALAPHTYDARVRLTQEITGLGIEEAAALLRSRQLSPLELTEACLSRIEALEQRKQAVGE